LRLGLPLLFLTVGLVLLGWMAWKLFIPMNAP
jgi:hypothetical protein